MKKALLISISLCLVVNILTGTLGLSVSAEGNVENSINKNLLEDMLNNRSWVIDTLVNDDFSTNPYAKVNGIADTKSMMATALSQYGNEDDPNYSAAYKTMVDTLNVWYNAGDYTKDVADGVTEWAADVLEFFGSPESAASVLRNCADDIKTMQYDNILQEVIKADYTSSSGQTLSGSNSQLVQLRKIQDGVGMLKSFASASKGLSGVDTGLAETAASYADTVLIPASESYQSVMNNIAKLTNSDMGDREQILLDLTTAMGMGAVYDSVVIGKSNSGGAATLAPFYLLSDDTKKIIDINADAAKFADLTIDSYMYVSSIQTQKESVAGVLDRTAEHLANSETRGLLNRYSGLIKDAADGKTSEYDLILTSIRNSGYIDKYVESKLSDSLKKLTNRFIPCYDQSIIPGAFASAIGVIGTATFLADAVTGLEDTCTKTVELKNLNQLITFFKATYERDLANYRANPTDENAAKIIDDLDFIQRLRLRGESIAYNMSVNQLDSYLGQLLSGGMDASLSSYYNYDYQKRIDSILGATINPFTTDALIINSGETLSINYDANNGVYGNLTKAAGNIYAVCDLEYKIINGINVNNGGKLLLLANISNLYIPYINNNGTLQYGGNTKVSELRNSGYATIVGEAKYFDYLCINGTQLDVYTDIIVGNDIDECRGEVILNGCSLSVNGSFLNEGVVNINNGTLTITGDFNNLSYLMMIHDNDYVQVNGHYFQRYVSPRDNSEYIIDGILEVKGNIMAPMYKPRGAHKTILSGNKKQNINMYGYESSGHFNILEITNLSSEGVFFEYYAEIKKELYSNGVIIQNSHLITLVDSAKIRGNVWNYDISLSNWTSEEKNTFNGNVNIHDANINIEQDFNGNTKMSGDVFIADVVVNINGNLAQAGNIHMVSGRLNVYSDFQNEGNIEMNDDTSYIFVNGNYIHNDGTSDNITAGTLEVKGDMRYCGYYRPSGTHKTVLSGNAHQHVALRGNGDSRGYYNILEITNTSLEGITFDYDIHVYKELYVDDGVILNSAQNILLTNSATIRNNRWEYDITLDNWDDGNSTTFNGDVYLNNTTLDKNHTFTKNLYIINNSNSAMNSPQIIYGNVMLKSSTLSVNDKLEINGNFTNEGVLKIEGDKCYILIDGNYTHSSGNSEYITAGTLEVKGDMVNCGYYRPTGSHKTVLSGNQKQNIYPYSGMEYGLFNILELANTSEEGIVFTDIVKVINQIYQPQGTILKNSSYVTLKDKPAFVDYGDLNTSINTCNHNATTVIPTWLDFENYLKSEDDYLVGNKIVSDKEFTADLYFGNSFEPQTATAIIAFYDNHSRLIQIQSTEIKVTRGKVFVSIPIENKAYHTYKLMIWDGLNSLRPLVNASTGEAK